MKAYKHSNIHLNNFNIVGIVEIFFFFGTHN
jgi:hypothetical protein